MNATPLHFVSFLAGRDACPLCHRRRRALALPIQWMTQQAIFECGAVFAARGEEIVVSVACPDQSILAAELWTIEAAGSEPKEGEGGDATG